MRGLYRIVSNGAGSGEADVDDGGPTLQPVVPGAMKEISSADGHAGSGGFQRCKSSVIVHDVIGDENFLAAAAAHIERGKIVERACSSRAGKQPGISAI